MTAVAKAKVLRVMICSPYIRIDSRLRERVLRVLGLFTGKNTELLGDPTAGSNPYTEVDGRVFAFSLTAAVKGRDEGHP